MSLDLDSEGLALKNNTYYKAIAIKTVWHSFKDRQTTCTELRNKKTPPQRPSDYKIDASAVDLENDGVFNKSHCTHGCIHVRKKSILIINSHHTKKKKKIQIVHRPKCESKIYSFHKNYKKIVSYAYF